MDLGNVERLNGLLEQDVRLREKIKEEVAELEKKTRSMVGMLNKVHSTPPESIPRLLDSVRPVLRSCQTTTAALAALVPPSQFWRWKEMWSAAVRTAVYAAALVEYLTSGTLISLAQAGEILGFSDDAAERLALAVEDYLHGLITLVNELSRLAVNAVTLGNFEAPLQISMFVKDLYAGFSMLNLKNDALRRRFDGLKYDLQKIEQVVYDVSLRRLAPSQRAES